MQFNDDAYPHIHRVIIMWRNNESASDLIAMLNIIYEKEKKTIRTHKI